MATRLVALYTLPGDTEEFDELYFETHLPLALKMPGLIKAEVLKLQKNLMGGETPYYMIAELTFEDELALQNALSSPEGKEAGKNLMGFASNYVTLLSAHVVESKVMEAVAQ